MVGLAMSIFEYLTKFLVIWHPWHPWVCIRSDLKPLETDLSDSSYCGLCTVGEFGSVCFQFYYWCRPRGVRGFKKAGKVWKKIRKYEFGGHPFEPKLNEDSSAILGVNVCFSLVMVLDFISFWMDGQTPKYQLFICLTLFCPFGTTTPLLFCTWFLKNQFEKIKFDPLDFILFRTGFLLPV